MCGIAGIISKNSKERSKEIVHMSDIISHRGPDGYGYYHSDSFSFGHRRLSIIDLTSHGAQPMEYMDRYVITYNGEVYNYIEIKNELLEKGYHFSTDTDTEVIMAAYDYWGKNCLDHFNGMWAFALFDKERNVIFCARDRFGVKPFYYAQLNEKFVIASEIKQFTVLADWKAVANKQRLYDFLMFSGIHDHTNETLFLDVFQLRGGEAFEYDLIQHSYEIYRWYNIENKTNNKIVEFDEAKQRFKELINDSVRLRMRSDVKVGSCLSGGLDSTSIVCLMNELLRKTGNDGKQETVSSCFNINQVDERLYIDEVIEKTGVKSHRVFPSFDNFREIDKIVWHQDEPFGSTSIYAQWSVYEEARKQNITVMLDGQGADEYLAGYSSFHRIYFRELLMTYKFIKLVSAIKNYQLRYHDYYVSPFRDLLQMIISQVVSTKIFERIFAIAKKTKKDNSPKWIKMEYCDDGKLKQITKSSIHSVLLQSQTELLYTSLPKLLHHQDRDSMAHSVESRVPFLDYRLIEFVIALPTDYKINNSITKYILRESLKNLIPAKIVNRFDKLGFATPETIWMKENNAIFRQELSEACNRLQEFIDKKHVLARFDRMLSHNTIDHSIFWRIICVGRWIKVFDVKI